MKNAYELIKKKKPHQKKRGKNINRQFTEEEMEMTNKLFLNAQLR